MASYELLDAVNLQDVRTTTDVAGRLNVDRSEAARQLRKAAKEGLVSKEIDLSASLSDRERDFWMLTLEGRAASDRLDSEDPHA